MLDRLHAHTVTEAGEPAVLLGFVATLYFENSHLEYVRDQVAAVVETYESLCGSHLRWAQHPITGHWFPYGSASVPSLQTLFRQVDQNTSWELQTHGGASTRAASDFGVGGFGEPAWRRGRLGYLRLVFPGAWLLDRKHEILDLVLSVCRRIRPVHGYGGLGILESHDVERIQQFQPEVYRLARMFPGLEVDVPLTHARHLTAGIKGVNWLTILDQRWLGQVPGLDALRAESAQFRFHDYEGGVVIQAGDFPEAGEPGNRATPASYARLARVLAPIRVTHHTSFHYAGPDRFDDESSMQWLARFDA